jgi:hypothetical protein
MLNGTEMTYKSDKSRQIPINRGNLIILNIKMHNMEVGMHVIEWIEWKSRLLTILSWRKHKTELLLWNLIIFFIRLEILRQFSITFFAFSIPHFQFQNDIVGERVLCNEKRYLSILRASRLKSLWCGVGVAVVCRWLQDNKLTIPWKKFNYFLCLFSLLK